MNTTSDKKKSEKALSKGYIIAIIAIVCVVAVGAVIFGLNFSSEQVTPIDDITYINVRGSDFEGWSYNLSYDDTKTIIKKQYNSMTYHETNSTDFDTLMDISVYRLTFYKNGEKVGYFAFNKDNKCVFEEGGNVCVITSGFDYETVKTAIENEISEIKSLNSKNNKSTQDEAKPEKETK